MAADAARIPLARIACAEAAPADGPVSPGCARADFLARVEDWRQSFEREPGIEVALYFEDSLEFAAALYGSWLAGKSPWLPGDTLAPTLDSLDGHVQFRAGSLAGAIAVPAREGRAPASAELDPDACQLVLFTSGSTGEPVAVRKSLRQLDNEVVALEAQFGERMQGVQVHGTVSHQHIYGLLFRVLWPLSTGRAFEPRRRDYNEELTTLGPGPLVLVASPAHLKRLPDNQDWRQLSQGLRLVFSSGGPLSADAAQDVSRLWGQAPVEVFGSTETGGIAWRQCRGQPAPWRALPGVSWRVVDGMLEIRSPHLPDGDWLRTPDRALPRDETSFELLGRADRILKLEERRVSLDALERRLLASPWLLEAKVVPLPGHRVLLAVAAVPSPAGAERLAADGKAALVSDLRAWLGGHVDAIALPRRWRFLDSLPTDAQGKSSQRRLQALFRPLSPSLAWQHRDACSARALLDISPELAVFDGHFPDTAVLPGVVMLHWAIMLGRECFDIPPGFEGAEALKFHHLVRPGARIAVELEWQAGPGVLGFRYHCEDQAHASGRIRFGSGTNR